MSRLDDLVGAARAERAEWSVTRADRVFARAARGAARVRAMRRAAFAGAGVLAVALVLLRGGPAPAAAPVASAPLAAEPELVAYDATGDGGFGRD